MDGVTTSQQTRKSGRTPLLTLTTFRFFAALAIVFFHAFQNARYDYLASGVSFFFVLSGFILTYVHPRIDGTLEFAYFWAARLARIWPVHLFTLAVVLILQPFGHNPFKHFYPEFFLNLFLLQCWVPVRCIALSFNFVSWSISEELFLYLVFPFLLPLVFKAPWKMVLGAIALYLLFACGAAWLGMPDIESLNTVSYKAFLYCPILHLYQFVLGMAVAVWWIGACQTSKPAIPWSWMEVFVFGATVSLLPFLEKLSLLLVQGHTEYLIDRQFADFLATSLFALLIYVFAFQAGILSRLFSHAGLVYLGDISFSTYMLHCIILSLFATLHVSIPPVAKWTLFGLSVLCASGLLYAFLEKPSRKSLVRLAGSFLKQAR
jgi:peptidoglycan/LPS O-acetylase OafA/YrhL